MHLDWHTAKLSERISLVWKLSLCLSARGREKWIMVNSLCLKLGAIRKPCCVLCAYAVHFCIKLTKRDRWRFLLNCLFSNKLLFVKHIQPSLWNPGLSLKIQLWDTKHHILILTIHFVNIYDIMSYSVNIIDIDVTCSQNVPYKVCYVEKSKSPEKLGFHSQCHILLLFCWFDCYYCPHFG